MERAGRARDQRRRRSAEQSGAQPGLCRRAQQAGPRAGRDPNQPGLGHFCDGCRRRIPDDRSGAGEALSQQFNVSRRGRRRPRSTKSSTRSIAKRTSLLAQSPIGPERWATFCPNCAKSRARCARLRITSPVPIGVRPQRRDRAGISPLQSPGTTGMLPFLQPIALTSPSIPRCAAAPPATPSA